MFLRHRLNVVCFLCLLFACALGGTALNSVHITAHAAGASMTLSATVGPPTSTVTINGTGYAPTQKLALRMDKTVQLGSVTTDVTGAFSAGITIPATTLPGHHTLFAASVQPPYISSHTGVLVQSDWPEFGYDSQHTNSNPYENLLSSANVSGLVPAWSERTGYQGQSINIENSVVVSNGIAYIVTYSGKIYGYNATTGTLLFITPLRTFNRFDGMPAVSNGLLYMGSGEGRLYAYNARTGTPAWISFVRNGFNSSPTISNNILYINSTSGHLLAFNATTGTMLWRYYYKYGFSSPAVDNNMVFASTGSRVLAFNATTGARLWRSVVGNFNDHPIVTNGTIYIGSSNGMVFALNETSGATEWSSSIASGYVSVTAITNGILYVNSNSGLVAVDATTGASLWTSTVGGSAIVANGVLYLSNGNTLYALDASTGATLWNYSYQYNISSPTVVNGMVYVGSKDPNSSGYQVDAFHLPSTP
jgi:outer membrane protein assembly factor BamB